MEQKEQKPGLLNVLERKLGLPPLSKLGDSLRNFPDQKQLELIKAVLETAERVSKVAPDLDKVVELVKELKSLDIEHLNKLDKILRRIESIIEKSPQEIKELLTSLKE